MKRFLLISVLVLVGMCIVPIHSWADDRAIALRAKTESKEPRSLFPVSAWIDCPTVYVSFIENPDEATVVITNVESGVSFIENPDEATVVITNVESGESVTESYVTPETVAIPLELSAGSCEIEIYYDDKVFVGEFELE